MSRWFVAIVDRAGKTLFVDAGDPIKAGAMAFEWERVRQGRTTTPRPVTDCVGTPLGMICGRDIVEVRTVETP